MDDSRRDFLVKALEAVLFAAGEPVEMEKIAALFEISISEAVSLSKELTARIGGSDSSFELCLLSDSLQLCTRQEYGDMVQKFLENKRTTPLSKAALEVLAVIAYKQPVTKGYVEQVRGVDCGGIVNTLVQRELVEEAGRLNAPGRPILYRTTLHFLRSFGLQSLEDLPGEAVNEQLTMGD